MKKIQENCFRCEKVLEIVGNLYFNKPAEVTSRQRMPLKEESQLKC